MIRSITLPEMLLTDLVVTPDQEFFNPLRNDDPGTGFQGLGFIGWMNNGSTDYSDQDDPNHLIPGGTSGIFTIVNTSAGDAKGSLNTQENAFQFGVNGDLSGSASDSFLVNARMLKVFESAPSLQEGQSSGIFIGTGDQDNYIKIAIAPSSIDGNSGDLDIFLLHEGNGVFSESFVDAAIFINDQADFFLKVNPGAAEVTPA